jgi:hypothetical protein
LQLKNAVERTLCNRLWTVRPSRLRVTQQGHHPIDELPHASRVRAPHDLQPGHPILILNQKVVGKSVGPCPYGGRHLGQRSGRRPYDGVPAREVASSLLDAVRLRGIGGADHAELLGDGDHLRRGWAVRRAHEGDWQHD